MDKAIIDGYVCVTDRQSKLIHRKAIGSFKEIIKGGAFQRSLNEFGAVPLKYNHDRIIVTGSDIKLYEDNIGLRFIAAIDDIGVISRALNGTLKGCSFGFKAIKQNLDYKNSLAIRTIEQMQLLEVSILDKNPAYASSVYISKVPDEIQSKIYRHRINLLRCSL